MIRRQLSVMLAFGLCVSLSLSADTPRVPTIDDLLMAKSVGGAQISPDGRFVAYTVTETDFKQDAFVTADLAARTRPPGGRFQLTRGDKSAGRPQWSPDGRVARLHAARASATRARSS